MAALQRQEFLICVWEREWEGESVLCIYSGVFLCLATVLQQYWKQAAALHEQPERGDDVSVKSQELPLLAIIFLIQNASHAWRSEWVPQDNTNFHWLKWITNFSLDHESVWGLSLSLNIYIHAHIQMRLSRDLQMRNISSN